MSLHLKALFFYRILILKVFNFFYPFLNYKKLFLKKNKESFFSFFNFFLKIFLNLFIYPKLYFLFALNKKKSKKNVN